MKTWIVGLVVLFAAAASLCGATFHVAVDGSDEKDGSAGAPWATIQHAVDAVAPGDTIIVGDGTYEGFRTRKSGKPDAVKTIRAANAHKASIDRPGPLNNPRANIEFAADDFADGISYWVVEGLESKNAPLMGFRLSHARHVTVRNCIARDCGKVGIFSGFMWDCIWERNTCHNNKQEGFYNSNSGDRNVIRDNYSHHNGTAGFHNNGDISMGGDGILSDTVFERNAAADNGESATNFSFDGIENSVIRNNLCHGGGKGIALYGIDAAVASRNNRVLNNTFVLPAEAWYAVVIRNHNPEKPAAVGNKFFNNILYHRRRAAAEAPGGDEGGSICVDRTALEGFESDYNVVTDRFGLDDNDTVMDFAGWRKLGYGAHSLVASEPDLFVDPSVGDFHLKDGSPAIDAGVRLDDVTDDLESAPRPQGKGHDIGCYEAKAAKTP